MLLEQRSSAGREAESRGDGRAPVGSRYRFGMLRVAVEPWQGRTTIGYDRSSDRFDPW